MSTSETDLFLSWLAAHEKPATEDLEQGLGLASAAITALSMSTSVMAAVIHGGNHPFRPEISDIVHCRPEEWEVMDGGQSNQVTDLKRGLYRFALLACLDNRWVSATPRFVGVIDDPIHSSPQWTRSHLLGLGGSGQVWAYRKQDLMVAVKEFSISPGRLTKEQAAREREILKGLRHPHVVTFLGGYYDEINHRFYLYTEYMPGGDLTGLAASVTLDASDIKALILQVLKGLIFLHGAGIVHRDIKDANMLISLRGCVKIADLGCARAVQLDDTLRNPGTAAYASPEIMFKDKYDLKTDIWSLGMTIIALFCSSHPWAAKRSPQIAVLVNEQEKNIPLLLNRLPPTANFYTPLLRAMLRDEETRDTATDVYYKLLQLRV